MGMYHSADKPQANVELLRTATVQEIAEFLAFITDPEWNKTDEYPDYKVTAEDWRFWLLSPASGTVRDWYEA